MIAYVAVGANAFVYFLEDAIRRQVGRAGALYAIQYGTVVI